MNRDEKEYLFVFILIAIIFLLASLADTCYGQEFLQWRWSHEPILKNPDASGLHCIGSAYLAGTFENTMKWWKADLLALGLGLAWEVKDGLVPCERVGILGGEGFSVNDLKMDLLGIATHRLGVVAFNYIKYKKFSFKKVKEG